MNPILIAIAVYSLIFVAAVFLAKKYTQILDQAVTQWQASIVQPLQEVRITISTHTERRTHMEGYDPVMDAFIDKMEASCPILPVVWMEDEPLHTDTHPFCSDPACPCRTDDDLLDQYCNQSYQDGLITAEEELRIFQDRQIV